MNIIKQAGKNWLWAGIVLVLAVGIRCYKVSEKEYMFSDEYMSVIISLYNNSEDPNWFYSEISNDSITYTGKEIKSLALSDDNSIYGILHDISRLRHSTRDTPHTNLYYSMLRASFLGADSSSMPQVILRGFLLNLLLSIIGFIIFYKLASRLFSNKTLVVCALAVAFLNPASVANTLFLRPYQLQETIFILFSYVFLLCYFAIANKKEINTWTNMLGLSFVVALTLLTGYFAVFYVFFLGLFLIYWMYKHQRKHGIIFFISVLGLAYIIVLAIYAGYNDGWLFWKSTRAREAVEKLDMSKGFLLNIESSVKGLFSSVTEYFLSLPLLFMLLLSLVGIFLLKYHSKEKKQSRMPIFISLLGFAWVLLIMLLSPYKLIRYIMPMLPIVSLFIPFILSYYPDKTKKILAFAFSLCMLVHVADTDVALEAQVVPAAYKEHPEIPLVVGGYEDWQQPGLIPFWTDERIVEISILEDDSISHLEDKINKYNELYIITQTKLSDIYVVPDGYKVVDESDIGELLEFRKLKRQ